MYIIFRSFSDVTVEMVSSVIDEIPQLISESDLHIAQLALQLLTLMFKLPVCTPSKGMLADILPKIYNIVKSPLLHGMEALTSPSCSSSTKFCLAGGALNAVLDFFRILVTSNDGRKTRNENFVSFRDVLRALIEPIYPQRLATKQRGSAPAGNPPLHKQAFHSTG